MNRTNLYALNICEKFYFKFYATGWGKTNYLWSFHFKHPAELFKFIDDYHCKSLVIHSGYVHGIAGDWLHVAFQLKYNSGHFDLRYIGEEVTEIGFTLPSCSQLPSKSLAKGR